MKIRSATRNDVDAIVALVNALSREEGDTRGLFTRRSCLRAGFGPKAPSVFLLAFAGEQPVGFACFFPGYDTGESCRIACVMDLYVVPERRREGMATRLLHAVARQAGLGPSDRLCWGLLPHRQGARQFYQALGAEQDSYIPMSVAAHALSERIAENMHTQPTTPGLRTPC